MIRNVISAFSFHACPQRNEPKVNNDNARKYVLLYPKWSAIHPEVGSMTAKTSMYAVITHSALSTVMPNDDIIFGSETSTMVASSTAINVPIITFARTHQRYVSCS